MKGNIFYAQSGGVTPVINATAFGLIVAVPGLVFYRMFQHKVDKLMINLQNQTSTFIDFIESL